VTVLFCGYKLGRVAAGGHVPEAFGNAHRIWDLERSLHLPSEVSAQAVLLHGRTLTEAANTYYATVHFPATLLFLLWMFFRRPDHYVWIRRVLTALTAAGLLLHVLFPLAPPRMLSGVGLVDTARLYGPEVYGPDTDTLVNQYAAMPSLHIGWASVIAIGLIVSTRSRWRWLWLAHPFVTVVVVVGTANHYWADGIVAGALLAVILSVLRPVPAAPEPIAGAPLTDH
jgi:hypothetical protein